MLSVRLLFVVLLTPALFFAQTHSGKDSVLVSDGFANKLSFNDPQFLVDSPGSETFTQVQNDSFSVPEKIFLSLINHPDPATRYWIKFYLENASDSVLDINLYPGYADCTDLYMLSPDHRVLHLSRGHLRRQHREEALPPLSSLFWRIISICTPELPIS